MKLLLRCPHGVVREEVSLSIAARSGILASDQFRWAGVMDRPAISDAIEDVPIRPPGGERLDPMGVEARQGLEALVVGEVEERLAVGPLDDEPAEVGAVEQVGDVAVVVTRRRGFSAA